MTQNIYHSILQYPLILYHSILYSIHLCTIQWILRFLINNKLWSLKKYLKNFYKIEAFFHVFVFANKFQSKKKKNIWGEGEKKLSKLSFGLSLLETKIQHCKLWKCFEQLCNVKTYLFYSMHKKKAAPRWKTIYLYWYIIVITHMRFPNTFLV